MQIASDYRKHAQDCLKLAESARVAERKTLLEIAHAWSKLADAVEFEQLLLAQDSPTH